MVALPPGDEVRALRLADLDEVLARHLERCLDGFGTAAHEVRVARAGGRRPDQLVGELLGNLRREEARVRVGELVGLRMDGRQHVGMTVPEAGNGSTAAGVEVLLAARVGDVHAPGADGHGRRAAQTPVEYVRHDGLGREIDRQSIP